MKTYDEIRKDIRSGDLLAWSHRGIRNWHDLKIWFVRLFTRSEYTHVGTAWVIGGRVLVIEAVMPLVRIYPLSKLGNFYWSPINLPWADKTEEKALSYVGCKYSQVQAMMAPFGKPPEDNLFECAELFATIAKADGLDLGTTYTPSAIVGKVLELTSTLHYIDNRID